MLSHHVELRDIRIFLALAEELHFGRTAERLLISQTRVSQTIQTLESRLGLRLFDRTSRRVVLTEDGARFLADVMPAYDQLMAVLQKAEASSGRLHGTLRLGQLSGPSGGPRLLPLIEVFISRHPDCRVDVRTTGITDPYGPLRRGEIDVMATWLPLNQGDIVLGPVLFSEPRALMVAADHPLVVRGEVTLEDLGDYTVPLLVGIPGELHEVWIPSKTPSGRPIARQELRLRGHDVGRLATLIARKEIVHPTVPSTAEFLGDRSLVCIPITDMPPMSSGLVWLRGNSDPRVREFARIAADLSELG